VARVERPVVGLADRAAGRIELGERLRQAHEVLEVGHRGLAPQVALAHERAAVDRGEGHVLATDVDRALAVARLQVELARRLGDLIEHELGIEDHLLAVDLLARGAELLDRLVEQELDPDLGDDPPPAAIEDGHGLLAEDLVARHRVDEHGSSSGGGERSPGRSLDRRVRRPPCYS
jgi:hypothetical protein